MQSFRTTLCAAGLLILGCTSKADLAMAQAEVKVIQLELARVKAERDSCNGRLSLLRAAIQKTEENKQPASLPTAVAPTENSETDLLPMLGSKSIMRAYEENEVAADEQFKDKHVLIVGHVEQIAKTFGHPAASIGPANWNRRINCRFDDDSPDPGQLRRGQLVILDCVGAGTTLMRSPAFVHCHHINASSVVEKYPTLIAPDPKTPGNYSLIGALRDELKN